jgi:hypothetical protein
MLVLNILQVSASSSSGMEASAVVDRNELILDESVAASPWNYLSSGCAVGGDLLEYCSQQISLDIQLSWERKIIGVGEIP